jgi:hydroxyethylthiazole kinase-like uncharacterized protein yjeF
MSNCIYGTKIFSPKQIKRLDEYTIEHSAISSVELMEKASAAIVKEFVGIYPKSKPVLVFCGIGNNGGDGLTISRRLLELAYDVTIYVVALENGIASKDFSIELQKVEDRIDIRQISSSKDIPVFDAETDCVIIDAILGSGLNRPAQGLVAEVIQTINASNSEVVAVDIASGLFASESSTGNVVIQPKHTFSFQLPKLAFLLPENEKFVGEFKMLDIGLSEEFILSEPTTLFFLEKKKIAKILKQRPKFSHKGSFGHVFLYAGSKGKMGAAALSSKAALRTGCGLVTVLLPHDERFIVQASAWEAMCMSYNETDKLPTLSSSEVYTLGMGPGIGQSIQARDFVFYLLKKNNKPALIDADALNILAANPDMLSEIPPMSILTPHPKEFERLVGTWHNDFERLEKQRGFSILHHVYVVLKGAYSSVSTPEGKVYFNSSGNPGMSTAGSGDVLTGIIVSLLAQHYTSEESAILGTFLHGLSGDIAAVEKGENALIASDIIECIPKAYKELFPIHRVS